MYLKASMSFRLLRDNMSLRVFSIEIKLLVMQGWFDTCVGSPSDSI